MCVCMYVCVCVCMYVCVCMCVYVCVCMYVYVKSSREKCVCVCVKSSCEKCVCVCVCVCVCKKLMCKVRGDKIVTNIWYSLLIYTHTCKGMTHGRKHAPSLLHACTKFAACVHQVCCMRAPSLLHACTMFAACVHVAQTWSYNDVTQLFHRGMCALHNLQSWALINSQLKKEFVI
jgi:hypothetical protein